MIDARNQLLEALKKGSFAGALFTYVLARQGTGWALHRGVLRFERTKSYSRPKLEYDHVAFIEEWLDLDACTTLLERFEKADTTLPYKLASQFYWHTHHRARDALPTPSHDPDLRTKWPCGAFILTQKSSASTRVDGPLISTNLPLYTDPARALADWLKLGDYYSSVNEIAIVSIVPDTRGSIGRVFVGEGSLVVRTSTEQDRGNLMLRASLHYGGIEHTAETESGPADDETTVPFALGHRPQKFGLFLFDKVSGDIVDFHIVDLTVPELPEFIELVVPEQHYMQFIEQGESSTVEFKEEVTEKIVPGVLAFANTEGGMMFIGVNNHAQVVGVPNAHKALERVRDLIEGNVDPWLEVESRVLNIEGKEILLLQVPSHLEGPCLYRNRGLIFVRKGSSNKPAKASEVEAIYRKRYEKSTREVDS